MEAALIRTVRLRANEACEYCQVLQAFYPTVSFPIDHIISRQHGGHTALANLALACLHCNSHKGPNVGGLDPKTGKLRRLFHPRRQKWTRHFRWIGPLLVGRTAVGRATVAVLDMNDPDLVAVRQALIDEGRFPTTA
jgi:HNH endonuclease